jgi:GDPmannose 4,6-dehydratase
MKKALITGITGQDGAYLSEILLNKGYKVYGLQRPASLSNTQRLSDFLNPADEKLQFIELQYGDLTDSSNLIRLIHEIQPDEIYNLGAMSHVQVSFQMPEYTANVDGIGAIRILDAIRLLGLTHKTRYYQASTSELFGMVREVPQTERTPFYPRSPYAAAKLYAYWVTVNYREAYGLYGCNGILFNHESPLRGETFVSRKISLGVARIALGMQDKLVLGNLDSQRDWGHARDYCEAMWLMLQQDEADDYVIATGVTTRVRDLVIMAFAQIGVTIAFSGRGIHERAVVESVENQDLPLLAGQTVVEVDPQYFRPSEVDILLGDSSKAREKLGWQPLTTLEQLCKEMIEADIALLSKRSQSTANTLKIF